MSFSFLRLLLTVELNLDIDFEQEQTHFGVPIIEKNHRDGQFLMKKNDLDTLRLNNNKRDMACDLIDPIKPQLISNYYFLINYGASKWAFLNALFYGPLIVKNIEMFLRGLKSTQKSIHDTEAETEKEEEVRIKFF